LTYNAEERCWEIKDITLTAGDFKFRCNDNWDTPTNWGGEDLNKLSTNPTAKSCKCETVGTYDVKFYAHADGYAKCILAKK